MKLGQSGDESMAVLGRYWVVPGEFLAGPYPGGWETASQNGTVSGLVQAGISHFVDLTQEGESAYPYYEMGGNPNPSIKETLSHARFSIPDMGTPSPEHMDTILNYLDTCLANRNKVYLHCLGGLGRTGTVVGCYLVRHGFTGHEALEQLTYLRRHTTNRRKASPETDEQIKYILDWHIFDSRLAGG